MVTFFSNSIIKDKKLNIDMDIIIEDIKTLCGKVIRLPGDTYHFKVNGLDCLYMKTGRRNYLRFVAPCVSQVPASQQNDYMSMLNQVNKEIRYIKALLLDNGNIAVNYDCRLVDEQWHREVVTHIIKTISFASGYITDRIQLLFPNKKSQKKSC